MEQFERELRKAMARREPSSDFTARVLAAAKSNEHQKQSRFHWLGALWAWRLVPVLAVLALLFGVAGYQRHERTVRGEQAKQQMLLAMRIAGSKLNNVQARIREVEQ